MARVSRLALFGLTLGLFGWLVAVGAWSWRRTSSLRLGSELAAPAPMRTKSSATTRIAGAAGGSVCLWGALVVAAGRPLGAIVALWGGVACVSGIRSRVTSLRVDHEGFDVRYAGRRPFAPAWGDVVALRPPRWPLGGWVLVGRMERRTLMPSDVLGQEQSLESIVGFAGLRFEGGAWVRGP